MKNVVMRIIAEVREKRNRLSLHDFMKAYKAAVESGNIQNAKQEF